MADVPAYCDMLDSQVIAHAMEHLHLPLAMDIILRLRVIKIALIEDRDGVRHEAFLITVVDTETNLGAHIIFERAGEPVKNASSTRISGKAGGSPTSVDTSIQRFVPSRSSIHFSHLIIASLSGGIPAVDTVTIRRALCGGIPSNYDKFGEIVMPQQPPLYLKHSLLIAQLVSEAASGYNILTTHCFYYAIKNFRMYCQFIN